METGTYDCLWDSIPTGRENAITYQDLCALWGVKERAVRFILHDLSCYDNGDGYVLIRSSRRKGFYRTDDPAEIAEYLTECENRGKSIFSTVKKCRRILKNT